MTREEKFALLDRLETELADALAPVFAQSVKKISQGDD